jgi:signal transduction histidine kinase
VDFVLIENGRTIYRTSADPLARASVTSPRTVQRIVIAGTPRRVAYIYSGGFDRGGDGIWLLPLAGLGTLLLTLGFIAWLVGRTVIEPLAAAGNAAHQIAAGHLEIELPDSRVREVSELRSAFLAMSRELQESLKRQAAVEEERRLFVSAIAHDLRTPLFSLRGYLEGLEHGIAATPQKVEQYIHICREKADAIERLIADLFAFTRVEYLEQTLQSQSLDLGALLRRLSEGRRREAEAKGVALELQGPSETCEVQADPQLLGRALENLLDNALRYTPSAGAVTVRWHTNGDHVVVTVEDTGPGIAPHHLARIFEPMYRADPSRSRETGGTGLGLAIARRIMRAHGGDLTASNREAGGARFAASLPIGVGVQAGPEPVSV